MPLKPWRGFTLVELVMVIALSGMVLVMISTVLARPLQGFVDQSRRAVLVDQAAGVLQRMARDVRLAVPNSLRVSADGKALELLLIHSAARYRPNRIGGEGLRFSSETAGTCGSITEGERCDSLQVLDPEFKTDGAQWMVLYNIGAESGGNPVAGSNVWMPANPGVITPTGTKFDPLSGAPAGESHIALTNLPVDGFRFAYASPQHRLYLAKTVVGYRCQDGQLLRYSYKDQLLSAIPSTPPAGSDQQPMAANVDCSATYFTYQTGSTQRAGLLAIILRISQDGGVGGEGLQLLQQVHVDNAP
ncbi:PulJ/GspJ family protein [Marinobacter sp. LV10MA510-1]|uniref:PulJ/GspJ family protein n=1 Tax=Marinobacter sp. LV10MA510-1 TaxID=1415567 RepID=UPI000BF2FF91|nr:type II secretion system protein [Marinobacter sp. LV10MA510-1]PFG10185.1 MSHA biogenesis protein MshO [Marinobacter sp. LV10MA510-1]